MDRQGYSPLAPIDSGTDAEAPVGLRAKNKAEKLQRIRKAARALFVKGGYDDTTMRDIATGTNERRNASASSAAPRSPA